MAILFEEPNPFIQEGNRTPVSKATHSRYSKKPYVLSDILIPRP